MARMAKNKYKKLVAPMLMAFMAGVTVTSLTVTGYLLLSAPATDEHAELVATTEQAAVELRQLASTRAITGTFGESNKVTGLPEGKLVSDVTEGKVAAGGREPVVELSGEPLFVMSNALGLWRDIEPGAVGKDVSNLQSFLQSAGFRKAKPHGTYDAATGQQVAALLNKTGYSHLAKASAAPEEDEPPVAQSKPAAGAQPHPLVRSAWFIAAGEGVQTVSAGNLKVGDQISEQSHLLADGAGAVFVVPDEGLLAKSLEGKSHVQWRGPQDSQATITKVTADQEGTRLHLNADPVGNQEGQNIVSATIVLETSAGKTLAVPQRAVRDSQQHGVHVVKITPEGATITPVSVGFAGQGWVEVRSDGLAEGDVVELP